MTVEISIVMPIFNQERYIAEAIRSILLQTFKNFELLILDDGSSDSSWSIINKFHDKRIRKFKHNKNLGLATSLNHLISLARGKYIARMDGDDISYKHRLYIQLNYLQEHPEIGLIGAQVDLINKKGDIIGEILKPIDFKGIRDRILIDNQFIHPSVIFRKDIWKSVGGYNGQYRYSQDYDFFLKITSKYQVANISEKLLKLRWHPDYIKQKQQHLTALKIRIKALFKYGYRYWELIKIIKPLVYFLIPIQLKKIYWSLTLKK